MPKVIGKNFPRKDAYEKVTGRAVYTDDITYPDMWHGAVVRAMIPRGQIRFVKFNTAFDWSKVVVCDWRDVPGRNVVVIAKDDQQLLVKDVINHAGEAVCLVAAPSKKMAFDALKNVTVEYEELPSVATIEESRAKKAIVYGDDNIISKYNVNKGNVDKAFASADFIVEGEYKTGAHEHIYLEPQGIIARPRGDGGFAIEGSLQCPYYVLKAMTTILGLPPEKVNVRQVTMGGAFGGKEDYPSLLAGYAVLLAKKCGRPVKIIYDRHEDILFTTKRHPSVIKHKTGVMKDGTLTAMEIDIAFDGGAYATLSPVVLARGTLHSWGAYKCPNVRVKSACYATNNVPTGAFRGFGAPQTLFAIESHIDVVADRIGMSPLELRRKNCLQLGDETATGQILRESVGGMKCLEKVAKASKLECHCACPPWWEERERRSNLPNSIAYGGLPRPLRQAQEARNDRTRKGVGLSLFMHGAGFTGSGEAIMKARAGIRLEKNGDITILTGCTDMGQGAHSVLPQIVAEALGVSLDKVSCAVPDTSYVPDSGPTVASRTTMVIGKVLLWCCEELKKRIVAQVFRPARVGRPEGLRYDANAPITIEKHYDLPPGIVWDQEKFEGDAYPVYAWGANVAEVTVDMETFEVTVDKMYLAYDVGKAINPQSVEGQLEGGTLQALGYALMEDMQYAKGMPRNNRLQTYIIPTAKDTPEFKTMIVEENFSWGPFGAKGLGELPLDGGAPAIANAIFNACGVRVTELPITAEKIATTKGCGGATRNVKRGKVAF